MTTIRLATADDVAAMLQAHYAAVQALAGGPYPADVLAAWSPPPDAARETWLKALIARDDVLALVAALPSEGVVAFAIALPTEQHLRALYVHPDHAGLGLGQGLLQALEARCVAAGVSALELNASYNAEPFYRRHGYQALGETEQQLNDNTRMGAIRMRKTLGTQPHQRAD